MFPEERIKLWLTSHLCTRLAIDLAPRKPEPFIITHLAAIYPENLQEVRFYLVGDILNPTATRQHVTTYNPHPKLIHENERIIQEQYPDVAHLGEATLLQKASEIAVRHDLPLTALIGGHTKGSLESFTFLCTHIPLRIDRALSMFKRLIS